MILQYKKKRGILLSIFLVVSPRQNTTAIG